MTLSNMLKASLVLVVLSFGGASAQILVGPWSIVQTPGQSLGSIVQCASTPPGMVSTNTLALGAVSWVTGGAPFGYSSCMRFMTATTTLTVGPAPTNVLFSADLQGYMHQQTWGTGFWQVSAWVSLDGAGIVGCNPPWSLLNPAVAVSIQSSRALCLNPGTHTLLIGLNTMATNTSTSAADDTTLDFFNLVAGVQRGFTVSVASQGPCSNDECGLPTPVVVGINPLSPGSGNTFSNTGATTSLGYPAICAPITDDVWFTFSPPTSGTYRIDTNPPFGFALGTLTDTVIAVYPSCAPAASLACDDNSGLGALSSVSVPLTVPGIYYIRVGGVGAAPASQGTFYLTIAQLMSVNMSSPLGPGSFQANLTGGPTGLNVGTYYFAFTVNQGAFPNGPFFGIQLTAAELLGQLASGPPITGSLDASGNATIGPVPGLPSGLAVYAVAIGFFGNPGIVAGLSNPASYVIP